MATDVYPGMLALAQERVKASKVKYPDRRLISGKSAVRVRNDRAHFL